MYNSYLTDAKSIKKVLQPRKMNIYFKLLGKLCQDYSHVGFVKPISVAVRNRDVRALLMAADSLSSQSHDDATSHFVANQFAALVKKFPLDQDFLNPEQEGYNKFCRSEHKCHRVNQRFIARRSSERRLFGTQIESMVRFIRYVLRDNPPLAEIWSECGFGPGAALGVHGNATNPGRKLSSRWSVSSAALYYGYAAMREHAQIREVLYPEHGGFSTGCLTDDFRIFLSKVNIVEHNKISFVPKTVKTHRSIAIEPLINGFLQKGIDIVMRKRLRRIGIDLSDQSLNQEMARLGSLPDQVDPFVTIDLSSASDSISIELCREVLPPEWFAFLDATRSKSYEYDGAIKRFHKFCSMGNGFCFPLETLLFVAACHACGAGRPGIDFRVYGDDIIVRQSVAVQLLDLLKYLGFNANADKTFITGPFRESCGADWFGGVDVRPFILDFPLDSIQAVFKFLNLSRRSELTSHFFTGVREYVLSLIPVRYHFYRPYPGPADTGIDTFGSDHLTSPLCRYQRGRWSWYEILSRSVVDPHIRQGQYGSAVLMYGVLSGSASGALYTLRNVAKTKVRRMSHGGSQSNWLPPPMFASGE